MMGAAAGILPAMFDPAKIVEELNSVYGEAKAKEAQQQFSEAAHLLCAAIRRIAPPASPYRDTADKIMGLPGMNSFAVNEVLGAVAALRADFSNGRVSTIDEEIHGAVFVDLLSMADSVLALDREKSFYPAAVVAGCVLEEHIRKLAAKHGVPELKPSGVPRSVEDLNNDLAKRAAYGPNDKRLVALWYAFRTSAAHARYDELDRAKVVEMIPGIRSFVGRFPA